MKCPKCGYLGFETTDRCRNCGYDFSLVVPATSTDLPLRSTDADGPLADLSLAPLDDLPARGAADPLAAVFETQPEPAATHGAPPTSESRTPVSVAMSEFPAEPRPATTREELPLFAPPAGNPLAVRRATTEVPKARRTTTRPLRFDTPPLPLVVEKPEVGRDRTRPAPAPRAPELVTAGVVPRIGAAVIDTSILLAIDVAVAWLTLRIAGLDATVEALMTLRPVPLAAFFLLLAFLYLVGFTLGGGQTIGKMALGLRVIGDDGRGVDASGAVVRAAGGLLSVLTLGLLFLPTLLSADGRAPYDRVAGTRVVRA